MIELREVLTVYSIHDPAHEILVFIVYAQKPLIAHADVYSGARGLVLYESIFIYLFCMWAVVALASLHICAGSPEALLLDNWISTITSYASSNMYLFIALASMIKSILILHYKEIPGNLNFKVPNPGIKGIQEGKLKVVDKPTPFEGKYWPKILGENVSYSSHEFK